MPVISPLDLFQLALALIVALAVSALSHIVDIAAS
jgi:hypothetical protein